MAINLDGDIYLDIHKGQYALKRNDSFLQCPAIGQPCNSSCVFFQLQFKPDDKMDINICCKSTLMKFEIEKKSIKFIHLS